MACSPGEIDLPVGRLRGIDVDDYGVRIKVLIGVYASG